MKPVGHVMILASAGSGKTYALTNRYVRLLAGGARPERIVALTFTRKAAGEFFDEIMKKLSRAAADGSEARKIGEEIGMPGMGSPEFSAMLRVVVDAMPRLTLGTIDSFFARIVRSFPLELGLGGDFEILEEHAARLERGRVLRRLFARGAGAPGPEQKDFIEAFKRATFGAEEKALGRRLDELLDEYAGIYLDVPDSAAWGRLERIWPAGCPWLAGAGDRLAAAETLQAVLPWNSMDDGAARRWRNFLGALPEWAPGAALPQPAAYILGNALSAWPELSEIVVERKALRLAPEARSALRKLVTGIVGAELIRRLEMTQGIFSVLDGYERVYDGAVRRGGRLTFADLQRLLRPDTPGGARPLSRNAATDRLFIDWRLDSHIDHWLLDEFQDTSFGQWSVLRNLVDEAVQDPSGSRSFFYVGDVKQAIFTWREGDPRLFREIFNHYNSAAPGMIREERLKKSYRSGPAVIGMVNRVFGDAAALRRLFPTAAAGRWSAEWSDHETALGSLAGRAELRHADGEAGRFSETLRILQEIRPLDRGLEAAVLVRTNDTAAALSDFLRREGNLPAVAESDLHVGTDNPLTCALLALFRAAGHPGDRAAAAHLRMTPLASILDEEGVSQPDRLTLRVLGEIHAHGFERAIESWLRLIDPAIPAGDAFSRERGRQFAAAGRQFDESGSRNVAEFVQFAGRYAIREGESASAVRVMTIHKAKGLGFDVVILPDLEGRTLAERRRGLAVQRRADRSVDWIMQLPSREFLQRDPVLSAHVAAAEADACYENLCLLYVALTRAKRALYVVVEPLGRSKSPNFPHLLQETLGEDWGAGDARWFDRLPAEDSTPLSKGRLEPLGPPEDGAPVRRAARIPSAEDRTAIEASPLFALDERRGAAFGSRVHELLSQVEWCDAGTAATFAAKWSGFGDAGEEALACLTTPELSGVWTCPPGAQSAEVWRERAFEIVLDDVWVSGAFDRVVVARDETGRATAATVYDFKTDRVGDAEAVAAMASTHEGQLNLYRRAAAVLAGLDAGAVACEIIFTRMRRMVRV